jgi:hypothetical protein
MIDCQFGRSAKMNRENHHKVNGAKKEGKIKKRESKMFQKKGNQLTTRGM